MVSVEHRLIKLNLSTRHSVHSLAPLQSESQILHSPTTPFWRAVKLSFPSLRAVSPPGKEYVEQKSSLRVHLT